MNKEQAEEYICERLTHGDVSAWHRGEMTRHVEQLMKEAEVDCIRIWGSHDGPEPLTVDLC